MNTNRDLNYRLYLHKTIGFVRTPISREYSRYHDISAGNVEKVRKNIVEIKKNYLEGKGKLSEENIRNVRYHVIIAVAMTARTCADAGMPHDTAYTLSDIYINRADTCQTENGLLDILEDMQTDFAERMRELKKEKTTSIHIRRCIDYIYDNLDKLLTIKELSEYIRLNESYLSKLFYKETGMTIKSFVHHEKIKTAENMLVYSDFNSSEIAFSLGFSSQSAFISVFKKYTGFTPKQYRDNFLEKTID